MLEDPWDEVPDYVYSRTDDLVAAPDTPEEITIQFKGGDAVAVNGEALSPAMLLAKLNELGKRHGIGRLDLVENRFVGMKSRGMYETPGGTIYHAAHRAIEQLTLDRGAAHLKDELMPRYAELVYNGFWFSPEREMLQAAIDLSQAKVDGEVRMKLYKGGVHITGRRSPNCSVQRKGGDVRGRCRRLRPARRRRVHQAQRASAQAFGSARPLMEERPHLLASGAAAAPAPKGEPRPWWESRPFVAAMILLAFVPLLYPPVPPLVDLLGHMGRYRVELDLANSPDLQRFYGFEWHLIGNLGVDLLIVPLAKVFGLELAVKLIVMSIPPLTVAGFLWVAREVHNRLPPTVLFALPFAFGHPFLFGFVNYSLAMAFAFLAFGLWLRLGRQGRTGLARFAVRADLVRRSSSPTRSAGERSACSRSRPRRCASTIAGSAGGDRPCAQRCMPRSWPGRCCWFCCGAAGSVRG